MKEIDLSTLTHRRLFEGAKPPLYPHNLIRIPWQSANGGGQLGRPGRFFLLGLYTENNTHHAQLIYRGEVEWIEPADRLGEWLVPVPPYIDTSEQARHNMMMYVFNYESFTIHDEDALVQRLIDTQTKPVEKWWAPAGLTRGVLPEDKT